MKLYEISERYQNIKELSENEAVTQEMLEDAFKDIQEDLNEKADNIAKVLKTFEANIKALKEEEKRLSDRRKVLENNSKNLKKYLEITMENMDTKKIKTNLFSFNIQKNPDSIEVVDQESIPDTFKEKVENIKIDKKAIKEAIKNGEEIEGVKLIQSKGLRIK